MTRTLTPEEQAWIRALHAIPRYAMAVYTEWHIPPRDRTARATWEAMCEAERFVRNTTRERGRPW